VFIQLATATRREKKQDETSMFAGINYNIVEI
jgi:hypothetical protein